jgi:hypothetical protein
MNRMETLIPYLISSILFILSNHESERNGQD